MKCRKITTLMSVVSIGLMFFFSPIQTNAQLLSASDSNIIKLSSTLWSDLRDIKFQQSKAFCLFFDGLTIVDLSDINSPSPIGQVELSKNGHKVDVSGIYAYVITKDSSMYLVDISSVNQPIIINSFKTIDVPMDIKVRDNCAFLAARNAGLLVVDVFDPFNISLIGSCSIAGFSAHSVCLHGNLAYLAGSGGLKVINVFFPYFPFEFGSSDVTTGVREVFVNADSERIYTYLGTPDELWILDATNPKNIYPLSNYTSTYTIADISFNDDYAYLGLASQGLEVLDTKDKTSPQKVASLQLGDDTKGVFFYSDFIFVADQFDPIKIINVFNPDRPFVSGRWILPGSCEDVAVKENFAYVICEHSGLHILNIADPSHPQIVSNLFAPYNNNGIDVEGDYAYFTALLAGLQVVDISDPYHPEVVGRYQPQGYTYGVQGKD